MSPLDCWLPTPKLDRSTSVDDLTHGRKLYYLFARDESAYRRGRVGPQPEGQAIVKEAWEPIALRPDDKTDGSNTVAIEGPGKEWVHFKAGPKAGLFIMLKRGGRWEYATVSADASRVTQSGQVASCLECHRNASHDSLFGTYMDPKDPSRYPR
ncbi:MAG TPA: hypothetical protein VJU16_06075 [Planctomycetota bacterium]|nr:hypothetical protein [Planctomycetota bacterium]